MSQGLKELTNVKYSVLTFLLAHDWERARVEMREAIHHDPGNAEAHSGLAYASEKLGNLQEALNEYLICTHLDPHDASYQRHYTEVLGEIVARQEKRKH
ncbi:MAG: tetratricopeptide repeat protein [Acidobacteria bacterium]|nr:tetratricopeptide repeat protein [Acidobacteriota bacterium]